MNKNFWKFVGGFLGILALAILTLFGFEYWQNYKEEQKMKNLIKEIQEERNAPPFENPLRSSP
jgi:predicted negative regulator of RcsB-dependent stress response